MGIRVACFLSLLLTALALGMAFCHALEIPGKLRLPGPVWLAIQHNLYVQFGRTGAVIEVGQILLAWVVVFLVRKRRPAFWWTLAGAVCVTVPTVLWAVFINPINIALSGWTAETLPANWTEFRDRWELFHAIRAALFAVGFSAFLIAALAETPANADRAKGP